MKTKKIPVNGKPEIAYGIFSTEKTQSVDFSCDPAAGVNPTREREIYRIIFRNWAYEFPLCLPEETVLTLDNIARLDYELEKTEVDVNLLWSTVTLLLPGGKTIKESEVEVELPYMSNVKVPKGKMRKVKVKVPKGRMLRIEGTDGGLSPIKALIGDETRSIEELEASKTFLSAQKPAETVKPEVKPIVTFSNDFLTVNCNVWKKSESRERARQANTVLRKLYENYQRGNKPMLVEKILKGISTERIDKLLDKNRYPQTFSLIRQQTSEKTVERKISLSDNYTYRAE